MKVLLKLSDPEGRYERVHITEMEKAVNIKHIPIITPGYIGPAKVTIMTKSQATEWAEEAIQNGGNRENILSNLEMCYV